MDERDGRARGKDTDVTVKRKDGKAENEEKQKSNRRIRVREGRDAEERIARRRYIMSGISRKIVSGARTAKMSVRGGARGCAGKAK